MQIRSTRCLGKYRQMYNRPVLVEFMVKEDADYLLNNRSYLPNSVYIDRVQQRNRREKKGSEAILQSSKEITEIS